MIRWLVIFFLLWSADAFAGATIVVLDAGEGDAILIRSPEGKTALVDCGNLITGHAVADALHQRGVTKLDRLILTHPDKDHIGGAFHIVQTFHPTIVYDNGAPLADEAKADDLFRWYIDLVRKRKEYTPLHTGDRVALGSVTLEALWPPKKSPVVGFNPNAMVIMVRYGASKVLLAADLVAEGATALMKSGVEVQADAMKAPHHGSIHGLSPEFFRAVGAKVVVVSVNADNLRGYPADETLTALKADGADLYRTDVDGAVTLSMDAARGVSVTR